ncbi:MAG: chorismate synthase [Saprospiraceae bacterium]|nr:chorismate synthase [Saprospiraceae bacterium]
MAGSSFGKIFKISTFGESHGKAIGVVIDGCPSGILLNEEIIQYDLDRRRPGQSRIVTQRKEKDQAKILSGVFEGKTLGTPIAILIENEDAKSTDYDHIAKQFRPSHADFTWDVKFGIRDYRGGGRSSARETAARVAAGAVAKQVLAHFGIEILSYVSSIHHLSIEKDERNWTANQVDANIVRCPDAALAQKMEDLIVQTRKDGDSIGGVVTTSINEVPAGWGEPVFDKLSADLGKAILSINACKGFEIGSGFAGTRLKGSEHNDIFTMKDGKVVTRTNFSGGVQGGISNGMEIYFKAAFKPTATLMMDQPSIDEDGNEVVVSGKGRHDPCVLPRAVPIVEAMTALVLADHALIARTNQI